MIFPYKLLYLSLISDMPEDLILQYICTNLFWILLCQETISRGYF